MRKIVVLSLLIIGCLSNHILCEEYFSFAHIYRLPSQNQKFYLETIPYAAGLKPILGKTVIYNSDSIKQYELPFKFNIYRNISLFLSNDGQNIAYIKYLDFTWSNTNNTCIELYNRNGLVKQYSLRDLIDCDFDKGDCSLFYEEAIDIIKRVGDRLDTLYKSNATEIEKSVAKQPCYILNDTIYIFAKTKTLIKLDINSGQIVKDKFNSVNQEQFDNFATMKYDKYKIADPNCKKEIVVKGGKEFQDSLASYLDMAIYVYNEENRYKYWYNYIDLALIVDTNGIAQIDNIDNSSKIPSDTIKNFIASHLFETSCIPKGIEKWRFSTVLKLMNKDTAVAAKEMQQYLDEAKAVYNRNIVADSISGVYIPKNMEDCFVSLNTLLKPKDIEAISKLKDKEATLAYHHGLGMWLRNNWGLWGGSRLQILLQNKGLKHPDDMSVLILELYYEWLHGRTDELKKFESSEKYELKYDE